MRRPSWFIFVTHIAFALNLQASYRNFIHHTKVLRMHNCIHRTIGYHLFLLNNCFLSTINNIVLATTAAQMNLGPSQARECIHRTCIVIIWSTQTLSQQHTTVSSIKPILLALSMRMRFVNAVYGCVVLRYGCVTIH